MTKDEIVEQVIKELQGIDLSRLSELELCTDYCAGCGKCTELNTTAVNNIVDAGASRISSTLGTHPSREFAQYIDHTLLKPEATRDDIIKLCDEAKEYGFASVCVNPYWVSLCAEQLRGTNVDVTSVIGFPLGSTRAEIKAAEGEMAISDGANELDMVINIGALKSGMLELVRDDIKAVVNAAKGRALVKVIIETALLTDEEKVQACAIAKLAGADYVKTSTGFSKGGATVKDVALMRRVVGSDLGVKAAGGIRDAESFKEMISSGATRIGASAGVKILKELANERN